MNSDQFSGFSFSGEIREPFPSVIVALERAKVAVTSVDAPSSWDIEDGPPKTGPGMHFNPTALVSLTAPKPLVRFFKGRHFLGGRYISPSTNISICISDIFHRFVSQSMANKYDLDIPNYIGVDQVVEIGNDAQRL
jgi:NAD(P)H-hydrate epimerase